MGPCLKHTHKRNRECWDLSNYIATCRPSQKMEPSHKGKPVLLLRHDLVMNSGSAPHCKSKVLLYSRFKEVFKMSNFPFVLIFNTTAMECGFMTLLSLTTAPITIRKAGFLIWKPGWTSEEPYIITLASLRFTSESLVNFILSANSRAFPALWRLKNDWSFEHISLPMVFCLVCMPSVIR